MANRTLRVLLKKIYIDGSIDTIYLKSRASDVFLDGSSTDTLDTIVTKVNGIQAGATVVSSNATNGYISINGTATQVYAHPNSGVTPGTYGTVTVDNSGHIISGSNSDYLLSSSKVTFTEATAKDNIVSNSDTIATMLGKLAKWYTSFGSLAWLSSVGTSQLDTTLSTAYNQRVVTGTANTTASVTESREITAAGYVADARAVANLQTQINTINSNAIKNITRSGTTFTATRLNNDTFTFTQQDSNTTYGAATGSALGLVKTGSNISNSSGTISLTKANVTAALGYTPPTTDTNTTYALATTSSNGLMSASDKVYLNKIVSLYNFINETVSTTKQYTLSNASYVLTIGNGSGHRTYCILVSGNNGTISQMAYSGTVSSFSASVSGTKLTITTSVSIVANCHSLILY